MPLLGNPSAAVLYPGKLVFALLPFESASVAYTLMHIGIACLGMYMLLRFWSVSRVGSTLAAFAFGFGGPVLFQYCNIIFLVGAAWIPWGLLAVERLLKSRGWSALGALAFVLALQTLGGDPQAAYITVIPRLDALGCVRERTIQSRPFTEDNDGFSGFSVGSALFWSAASYCRRRGFSLVLPPTIGLGFRLERSRRSPGDSRRSSRSFERGIKKI